MEILSSTHRPQLFTMGYEGRDIKEFIQLLHTNDIETVVDVREVPISRKRDFSKSNLQKRLKMENIDYIHIRALGSPRYLRKKVHKDNDFNYFSEKYEEYLEKCDGEIARLHNIINENLSCLLCFERNPSKCHRTLVALRVKETNGKKLRVQHI